MVALAGLLMTWGLVRNGYANSYYASAVYAAGRSWPAFLFNALDLSRYLTVDKTPLSVWMMALSARAFGFGAASMLIPNALCGVASVLVLHDTVRRSLGPRVAILAALALALTPVVVVISRFNNPDALLLLLLVSSAWAATRAMESGRTRDLVLCGVLVGLAFNTKMLQAYLVVPALATAFMAAGPGRPRRRLVQLGVAGAAMLAVSLAWVTAMTLVAPAERPWVGDTTDDSWWQLVFGANGIARIGIGLEGSPAAAGTGPLRLLTGQTGGQIAWLMPLAAAGLAAGLWTTRRVHRRAIRRGAFLLWGGWALVHVVVFSFVVNIFHPYYTSALAPALSVLAASALVTLWDRRTRPGMARLAAIVLAGSAGLAILLLARTAGFVPWLPWVVAALALLCAAGWRALARRRRPGRWLAPLVAATGLAAVFAGPAAYAVATLGRSVGGIDPVAGPPPRTPAAQGAGGDAALLRFLSAHRGRAKYLAAVGGGSVIAAPLILASRQPVVTMGGFAGTDPAPNVSQLRGMIRSKQLRFVLLGFHARGGGGAAAGIGLGGGRARARWITSHCRPLPAAPVVASPLGPSRQRLYDCAGAA